MAQIIDNMDNSIILRFLYNIGDLKIWPETSLNEADPTKPLVVLLHGLDGSMQDMTDPMITAERAANIWAYDINWSPPDIDRGWHFVPPNPLTDLLQEFFDSEGMVDLNDIEEIFRDYIPESEIIKSPLIGETVDGQWIPPANADWFGFFESRGFPVIAYNQSGGRQATGRNAYPEFLSIMEDIHTNLLGNSSCRKIALVGHSRGGFIARKYVVEALFPGDLPSIHESIVRERVRFLGTLNSPNFGSNLTLIPAFLNSIGNSIIPFIGGWISNELQNVIGYDDAYLEAFDELRPDNPDLMNINVKDLALLAAASVDDSFEDLNLSVMGIYDWIKRIRRASTSGNRPLLRRYFSSYFYHPSSFTLDPFCVLEASIPEWDDLIPDTPRCFHHIKTTIELPFSPFIDDFVPPTFMDFARGILGPFVDNPMLEELHARRMPLHPGGDLLVGSIQGIMPFSHHQTFNLHHYFALWDLDYKLHFLANIPDSFCYPRISFRVGDNIVELIWERISWLSEVRVFRFEITGDTVPSPQPRSDPLPVNETLFYDIVKVRNPLSYLISYKNSYISEWAHELDDQAFREATEVGSLAVLIQNIIEDEGQEYRAIKSRIASSRVVNNFLVFSVNHEDLLSDCINNNLEPIRIRQNVTNHSTEEDRLYMRLSNPFANSFKNNAQEPDNCLVAWVEYKITPIGGGETLNVPGSTSYLGLEDGNNGIGILGGYTQGEGCLHIFRLMAGYFDENGETDEIKEILPITCAFFDPDPFCMLANLTLKIMESPLFVKHEDGFLFVTAGGSPFRMWVVTTDENLNRTGSRFIQLRNSPFPILPTKECPINSANISGLKLHDLVSARKEGYFFAILGQSDLDKNLIVVSFEVQGNEVQGNEVVSHVSLPWVTNRVQATVFSEAGDKLLLFASSPIACNPQFAIIPINNDRTLDTSNVSWTPISISGLLPPPSTSDQLIERFHVQDTLRRCVKKAEFLVSLTGFFQDEEISSSLYRIEINDNGTYSYSLIHHSGFGQYDVTWSRVNFGC